MLETTRGVTVPRLGDESFAVFNTSLLALHYMLLALWVGDMGHEGGT